MYSQARRKSGVKGMEIMPDTPIRALGRLLWAKLKNGERYVSPFLGSWTLLTAFGWSVEGGVLDAVPYVRYQSFW